MENNITLRAILDALHSDGVDPTFVEVTVNADPVWDYKDTDGKLSLIHENNSVTAKYEHVNMGELIQDEFLDLPIVSEHLGDIILEAEILKFRSGKRLVNFKIKE